MIKQVFLAILCWFPPRHPTMGQMQHKVSAGCNARVCLFSSSGWAKKCVILVLSRGDKSLSLAETLFWTSSGGRVGQDRKNSQIYVCWNNLIYIKVAQSVCFHTAQSLLIDAFQGQGQHWSLNSCQQVLKGVWGRRELITSLNTKDKGTINLWSLMSHRIPQQQWSSCLRESCRIAGSC